MTMRVIENPTGIKLGGDALEALERLVPEHSQEGLIRWIEHGIKPGDFLMAVLRNDLKEAVGRADDINQARTKDIVRWMISHAPSLCWGTPLNIASWATCAEVTIKSEQLGEQSPWPMLVIHPDGSVRRVCFGFDPTDEDNSSRALKTLQDVVSGYIELVRIPWRGRIGMMIVDDEGVLKGAPFNKLASQFYPGPTGIRGTAVICDGWRLP